MNKKMLELINSIADKKNEIKSLVDAGKLDEAKQAKESLKEMQDAFDILRDMEDDDMGVNKNTATPAAQAHDAVHEFANAARQGFRNVYSGNQEGVGADGGYTVPADIQARVEALKEAHFNLGNLASVEPVTTMSGRRTYKKRSQHTGFNKVGEAAKIGKVNGPQFGIIEYTIGKYAGYLPVTNELLADSDANITAVLTEWLAEEDVATRNNLVIGAIEEADEVEFETLDDIKKAVNVTLGSKFAGSVAVITNDDGLQYLDTLKDANGRYLLSANANEASPFKKVLAIGASNIPVMVVPNEIMATGSDKKIPMTVGSLKDYVKIFDRQKMSIMMSNEAATTEVNAFEEDLTLFRAIDRLDVQVADADAIVRGYIQGE